MRILGVDPGYAIVGYGAIDYDRGRFHAVGYGAITTDAGEAFDTRLLKIYNGMNAVIRRYQPQALAIERLYFTTNQKTAIDVAQARGVIMLSAAQNNVAIYEYTPLQVKQSVVGYGKAEKHQVMEMTKRLLKLEKVPKPDDTADALAVAICHCHCAGSSLSEYIRRAGAI